MKNFSNNVIALQFIDNLLLEQAKEYFDKDFIALNCYIIQEGMVKYIRELLANPYYAIENCFSSRVESSPDDPYLAKGHYTLAIEFQSLNKLANHYTGLAKLKLGDHQGGIKYFTTANNIGPVCAIAYNDRGKTKVIISEYTGVYEDFTKAIEVDPHYSIAFNNQGPLKDSLMNFSSAIEYFSPAIRLNPNYSAAFSQLWNTRNSFEYFLSAIDDYSMAIKIDPENPAVYIWRGTPQNELDDVDGSDKDYKAATEAINLSKVPPMLDHNA